MRNITLVIKHEIISTITKPSFWLTTFVLPVFIMVTTFGSQLIGREVFETEEPFAESAGNGPVAIGYVDQANLIAHLPEGVPPALVQAFPDEASAQMALEAGELRQYYLIPADYVETGALFVIDKDFAPMGNFPTAELFEYILNYNLLGDSALASRVSDPVAGLQITALKPETTGSEDFDTRFVIGYGVLFIFFFVLTMSSSFMLRSVSSEKENRTVEVLLLSLRPRDLMLGKVLGLGTVALLQMGIWLGGSFFTLDRGGSLLASLGVMLDNITFPPGFLVWVAIYFLLGYLLYASLLGAIGALAPSARETGQFTFIAMLPLMLPLWMNTVFIEAPNGVLATIISLFPLTAPTSMLPRLVTGGVPLWQPIVGSVMLAAATYAFVLIAGRFFRADTLLSSASLSWGRIAAEFKRSEG